MLCFLFFVLEASGCAPGRHVCPTDPCGCVPCVVSEDFVLFLVVISLAYWDKSVFNV